MSLSARRKPPFRAEHVGSLHRPQSLRQSRIQLLGGINSGGRFGPHGNDQLRRIEDEHIRTIVRLQEEVGLKTITDGEYRRQIWLSEFLGSLSGIDLTLQGKSGAATQFKGGEREGKSKTEDVENVRIEFHVNSKIHWNGSVNAEPFRFLKSITTETPKVTVPAPQNYYYFGGRQCVSTAVYPDIAEYWSDMSEAYAMEVKALAEAGCTHMQFDDVVNACLCDDGHVAALRSRGEDPDQLMHHYVDCLNWAIEARPESLTISLHICRGNRHGHYVAQGGYDHVAEFLFNNLDIDAYYLEYDSARAGTFEPLRFMPQDKFVVLGLITTKRAELEDENFLKRRIDEAAKYVDLDRLAISPQCGFSGDMMSDVMSIEQMKRKLELVVRVARSVWGEA